MWDTGPGSTDMKTGMHLMPWYTMWEAVPVRIPDIISYKIRYSSRNNIYLDIQKYAGVYSIIIQSSVSCCRIWNQNSVFTLKGFGREYIAELSNGIPDQVKK